MKQKANLLFVLTLFLSAFLITPIRSHLSVTTDSYSDEFNSPVLNQSWMWINEDPNRWSLSASPGNLRIMVAKGDMVSYCGTTAKNVLLKDAPLGNFEVISKVNVNAYQNYHLAGIIAFNSVTNYVKVGISYNGPEFGGLSAITTLVKNNQLSKRLWIRIPTSTPAYLRMVKVENQISGFYSQDGNNWQFIGSINQTDFSYNQFGLYAFSSCFGNPVEVPADFDYFRVQTGFTVSGKVLDALGNPISGIIIASSSGGSISTDNLGNFVLSGLLSGSHIITPINPDYEFSPPVKIVTVPPDKTWVNFVALQKEPECTIPFFSQNNELWADSPLRTDGRCSPNCGTIGACGCTLTAANMLFDYFGARLTPPELSDCMGTSACPFDWKKGASCAKKSIGWVNNYNFSWQTLNDELNIHKRPVLLGMYRKANRNDTHWVLVTAGQGSNPSNYTIHDPYFLNGRNLPLSTRSSMYVLNRIAVYKGTPSCSQNSNLPGTSFIFPKSLSPGLSNTPSVTGKIIPFSASDTEMIYQLDADSSTGNIIEMKIWTNGTSNSSWEAAQTLVTFPLSDETIYVQFKDSNGNISEVYSSSVFPTFSPPEGNEAILYLPFSIR